MVGSRKSYGRGKRKSSSKGTGTNSSNDKSQNRRSSRVMSKKMKNKWSPISEGSPFKGFDESAITPVVPTDMENYKGRKLFEDRSEDHSEDKNDMFDKLLDPNYKSNFLHKNIRTYSNKKRDQPESRLLEFQDCKNREAIVQWLNDNCNVFDRLTQTQRECVSEDDEIPLTLDMPSVSQVNTRLNRSNHQSGQGTRRSPYKLRARSLDIQIKKNGSDGRSKRHSLAGDTPSMENYHIEEVVTDEEAPVPAEKIIVDLIEDEYLDNIEREMLQQKNQSVRGWERIRDISKTINNTKKKPKQLNITLQSSQHKKGESLTHNRSYSLDELENYFLENMEKIMNVERKDPYCSSSQQTVEDTQIFSLQNALHSGKTFLTMLKKLPEKQNEDLIQLHALISKIKGIFSTLKIEKDEICEASTQTLIPKYLDKQLQTETSTVSVQIQSEDLYNCQNCANNNNVIKSNKLPYLVTSDKSVQCTQQKKINTFMQTETYQTANKKDVKVQTEPPLSNNFEPSANHRNNQQVPQRTPASAIHSDSLIDAMEQMITPSENCNLDKTLDDICFNTEDAVKELQTLEVRFKTEDILREATDQKTESRENESKVSLVEGGTSKGVKRLLSKSPHKDSESFRNKRPCNKFIQEDLSIDFESCAENANGTSQNNKIIRSTEDSDDLNDYEEYLVQVMKKYDNDFGEVKKDYVSTVTRTQEDMERMEDVIRNVTKPAASANERPPFWSSSDSDVIFVQAEVNMSKLEKDFDYFKTDKTPKKSRRSLFSQKNDSWKFSESIFFSDNEETVVQPKANRTITQSNVDEVIEEFNRENANVVHEVDKEVQEILSPKEHKINILHNIVVKPGNTDESRYLTPSGPSQDADIIEATPQKKYNSRFEQRSDAILDITLPPPLEFQDLESQDKNKPQAKIPDPQRRPLATVNKVTSTPVSQKNASELLSLSPISFERSRILGPIEMAQQQKFSPLTIVKKAPSQKCSQSTPKQKSILNYVTSSQESQPSPTAKNKPCVACTRISRDQVMGLTSMTNKKLASYSSTFSPKVTHMIVSVDNQNRIKDHTIKSVSAVAAGIWVLSFGWVRECLAKNCIIPEEPYEVLDVSGVPGPKTARLQRTTNPLFKGYKIHAAPPFASTTQQDVENICKMLGGKVARILDELMENENYIRLIIAEAKATQDCDSDKFETWLEIFGVVTVDLEWLSRSVSQYSLQPLRPFTLCSEDTIGSLGYPPELLANVPVSFLQSSSSVPSS